MEEIEALDEKQAKKDISEKLIRDENQKEAPRSMFLLFDLFARVGKTVFKDQVSFNYISSLFFFAG